MTERLRELLGKATPGPWRAGVEIMSMSMHTWPPPTGPNWGSYIQRGSRRTDYVPSPTDPVQAETPEVGADAALIVEAVNALPALLDAHDRMAGALRDAAGTAHMFARHDLFGHFRDPYAFDECPHDKCPEWAAALAVPKEENLRKGARDWTMTLTPTGREPLEFRAKDAAGLLDLLAQHILETEAVLTPVAPEVPPRPEAMRGWSLSFDVHERWLVLTDPEGASEIVARDVDREYGGDIANAWAFATTPEPPDSGDAAALALDYLGGMWSWNDAYLDDPGHAHLWVVLAGRILREMVGRPARDPHRAAAAPAEAREEGPTRRRAQSDDYGYVLEGPAIFGEEAGDTDRAGGRG